MQTNESYLQEPEGNDNLNNGWYPDWMRKLDDFKNLGEVSIPGTHNSGTKSVSDYGTHLARCQNQDILQQLKDGIRFLDIRLDLRKNELQLYHNKYSCNISFDTVLSWCQNFLIYHQSEIILMCVKQELNTKIADKVNEVVKGKYANLFFTEDRLPQLREVRGRIVLFNRYGADSKNTHLGINWSNGWKNNATFTIQNGSTTYAIEDRYQEYDTSAKLDAVITNINNAKLAQKNVFCLSFVSIASKNTKTPYKFAWGSNGMNPALIKHLREHTGKNNLGTVVLDYYSDNGQTSDLLNMIINSNFN